MLPEVLIYLQVVKKYLSSDDKVRKYFLENSNENDFYDVVSEMSEINFKKTGDTALTIEQFEEIRKKISVKNVNSEPMGHFFYSPIYGSSSLN